MVLGFCLYCTVPYAGSTGSVTTPPGFREAYRKFVEAGWNGLDGPTAFGGQGLVGLVAIGVVLYILNRK